MKVHNDFLDERKVAQALDLWEKYKVDFHRALIIGREPRYRYKTRWETMQMNAKRKEGV